MPGDYIQQANVNYIYILLQINLDNMYIYIYICIYNIKLPAFVQRAFWNIILKKTVSFHITKHVLLKTVEPTNIFCSKQHHNIGQKPEQHHYVVPSLKLTAKAPENKPSQKETSLPTIYFRGYVRFREGNLPYIHSEQSCTNCHAKHGGSSSNISQRCAGKIDTTVRNF